MSFTPFVETDLPSMENFNAKFEAIAGDAAPSGYGLGKTTGKIITDLNDATENGWYYFGAGTLNVPELLPSSAYSCALVITRGLDNSLQIVPVNNRYAAPGYIAIRHKINSVWQPWEYVNPPMSAGVEYRTTERFQAKPVYIKLVNCGAMPEANAAKNVSHEISDMAYIVSFGGSMTVNGTKPIGLPYRYTDNNLAYLNVDHSKIQLISGATSLAGYASTYVWVKYTKTTN